MSFWSQLGAALQNAYGGNNPNEPTFGQAASAAGASIGVVPQQISANAPGSTLDTSGADSVNAQQGQLAQQLLQQAQNGDPAAAAQLQQATNQNNAAAAATGQAMAQQNGESNLSAARDILNAQAANNQGAAGQGDIIQAEGQIQAQNNLQPLLAGQGAQDVTGATEAASAAQGTREANLALSQGAQKNATQTMQGAGTAVSSIFSAGGKVPGKAAFGGDDPRNDTVSAKLSPGEYVVSREDLQDPSVRSFVDALKRRKGEPVGKSHFDTGGLAPGGLNLGNAGTDASAFAGIAGPGGQTGALGQIFGAGVQDPSIANGGLLDTSAFGWNQGQQAQLGQQLAARAAGTGPSVAPQEFQNAKNAGIAQALLGGAQARGGGNASAMTGGASRVNQMAAGQSGATVLGETGAGQQALAQQLIATRGQQQQLAQAQQQAAFQNTETNAGISLANQAAARQLLGAAGTATTAGVSNGGYGGSSDAAPTPDSSPTTQSTDPYGDIPAPSDFARGGEIEDRGEAFAKALTKRKTKGTGFQRMMKSHADHSARIAQLEKAVGAMQ